MTGSACSDLSTFRRALVQTAKFAFTDSIRLVAISVCWFFGVLLIVTVGPVTLGAYTAILSVREHGDIDQDRVYRTVRRNWVDTLLLGLLPILTLGVALLYLVQYTYTIDIMHLLFGIGGVAASAYVIITLIPTFVAIASGETPEAAVKSAFAWTASHSSLSMYVFAFTAGALLFTALLTIGFIFLFPAIAFSHHIIIHELTTGDDKRDELSASREVM